MGKVTGFLEFDRVENKSISPKVRVKNFKEFLPTVEIIVLITYWRCYLDLPSLVTKKNQVILDSRGVFNSNDFPSSKYLTTGLR